MTYAERKKQGAHRSLICLAMVKNACSTFVAFFADVSRNGIDSWSAKSCRRGSAGGRGPRTGRGPDLRGGVLDDLLARQV
jgi:hypothetical protein